MNVLWIAFTIYIIGIAAILYYRPSIMFRQDGGTWKEFGLSTKGSYTVFPFWLFTVLWAFFSYLVATMGTILVASATMRSMQPQQQDQPSLFQKHMQVYSPPQHEPSLFQRHTPAYPTTNTDHQLPSLFPKQPPIYSPQQPIQQPGYYVLEPRPSGPPKYIYFGLQPPKYNDL